MLGAILLAGIALRQHDLTRGGLWMDELWAASFVQLGLKDLLVAVIRFDVHPPAYYMQLNVWSALFGRSDAALLANSVAWSALGIAAVWWTASRILDPMTGLLAAALTAASGSEVFYGQELRMYAMVTTLTVVAWHLAERYARRPTLAHGLWLLLCLTPLALAHGANVVPISCVMVFLALRLGIPAALHPRRLWVFVLAGAVCLPAVANSSFRGVSHTHVPDAEVLLGTVGGWLIGYFPPAPLWLAAIATAIVVGATMFAIMRPETRPLALGFLVWPVLFVLSVSLALRPIWIARLMSFCAPFACIVIAAAIARLASPRLRLVPSLVILVPMVACASGQGGDGRKMEYRETAAFLREQTKPGDLILIPEHVAYWGIARYFAGPSWGNLLTIQDPVRPGESTAWDPVYARLGPDWLRWLNLIPQGRMTEVDGRRLMIGGSPDPAMLDAARLWVVGSGRVRPEAMPLCPGTLEEATRFRGLTVNLWGCNARG